MIRNSRVTVVPSGIMDVQVQAPAAAVAAALPYSLAFTSTGYVDLGIGATINNLHQGLFTVDAYVYVPAVAAGVFVGQTNDTGSGWTLSQFWAADEAWFLSHTSTGGASAITKGPLVAAWKYIRARRSAADGGRLYLSVNASTESQSGANIIDGDTASGHVMIGSLGGKEWKLNGSICYIHLYNNDQGALASVPTSPLPIGANTAARYIFGNGSGGTLTDDSGNLNHGTITNGTWSPTVPSGWTI